MKIGKQNHYFSPLLFLLAVMVAVVGGVASSFESGLSFLITIIFFNHDYLLVIVIRMMVVMMMMLVMMAIMVMRNIWGMNMLILMILSSFPSSCDCGPFLFFDDDY